MGGREGEKEGERGEREGGKIVGMDRVYHVQVCTTENVHMYVCMYCMYGYLTYFCVPDKRHIFSESQQTKICVKICYQRKDYQFSLGEPTLVHTLLTQTNLLSQLLLCLS